MRVAGSQKFKVLHIKSVGTRGRAGSLFGTHTLITTLLFETSKPLTDVWFHVGTHLLTPHENTGATRTGTHRCDDELNLPLSIPTTDVYH